MKKVLSTVAALGLVAGLASTAAAVEFSMSGDYTVDGVYMSTAQGNGVVVDDSSAANGDVDHAASDAYYMHTFRILPVMKVNDKVTMKAEIRLADNTYWGNQAGGDLTGSDTIAAGNQNDFYLHRLYMEYASPLGNFKIGRVPSGPYGTAYLDTDTRADKIIFNPSFLASGPWSTEFHIIKAKDNDAINPNTRTAGDSDSYEARLFYKEGNLDSGLRYAYTNNRDTAALALGDIDDDGIADTVTRESDNKQMIVLYGKYKMDNYFANAELVHNFGEVDGTINISSLGAATGSLDYDSWAGMLQVGAKVDALTPSLTYFYGQGQDTNSNDIEAALLGGGTGTEYEPLYILTGRHTGMLNPDIHSGYNADMSFCGVHAVVAAADYAVSKELTLHGAIGWAQADETPATVDDEYGWEYNVGAAYKLLDNLTYEAHFGYLDTGDFFQYGDTTNKTENVYLLTHSLTMTF